VRFLIALSLAVVSLGAGALAHALAREPAPRAPAARPAPPRPAPPELPPLPAMRPKVVEPEVERGAGDPPATGRVAPAPVGPAPSAPASGARRSAAGEDSAAVGGPTSRATALANGIALPPFDAPAAVKRIIAAGNVIARAPYKWGGGHGRWRDEGYDCSGSVSFALHFAGLLEGPLTSGGLMSWGEAGRGRWVTVYANDGHVFLEVAGIRFDTSGARRTGSRWQPQVRPGDGYVARHPPGL